MEPDGDSALFLRFVAPLSTDRRRPPLPCRSGSAAPSGHLRLVFATELSPFPMTNSAVPTSGPASHGRGSTRCRPGLDSVPSRSWRGRLTSGRLSGLVEPRQARLGLKTVGLSIAVLW